MTTLVVLYLLLLALVIGGIVLRDALSGYEEILSLRNFFFLGFVIFQVTGAAYTINLGGVGEFLPADIPSSSVIYSFMVTVFLVLFLASGRLTTGFADRIFSKRQHGGFRMAPTNLLAIAAATIPTGLVAQFVLSSIPVVGPAMGYLAFGLYAVGAGLAAWVAAPRLINPAILVPALGIILLAMALTFYQNFGRRDLLGVIVAVMWAAYYSRWRAFGPARVMLQLSVIGVIGVVLIFAVTSVRSPQFRDRGIMQNILSLREAKLSDGFGDVLSGQAAAMASMWLIESRPDSHEYDTLHSVKMVLLMPIPRRVWPDKPTALALTMPQRELHIAQRPDNYNIGPGLIGHIENDNPWLALWMYPIFLGVLIRVLDRATAWFADDPFIVLPMGAAIGQFIGMPRGELGSFFFIGVLNIIGAFVMMQTLSYILRTIGLIKRDDPYTALEHEDTDGTAKTMDLEEHE